MLTIFQHWLNLSCVHIRTVCVYSFYISLCPLHIIMHPLFSAAHPPSYPTTWPPRWPTLGSDSGTTRTESLLPHTEMEPCPCPEWRPCPGLHSASDRAKRALIWSATGGKWHYSRPSPSHTWEEVRCGGVCQECVWTRGAIRTVGCLYCQIRG